MARRNKEDRSAKDARDFIDQIGRGAKDQYYDKYHEE